MEELRELRLCQPGRKHCHKGPGQQGLLLSNLPLTSPWELGANGRHHWLRPLCVVQLLLCNTAISFQWQAQIEKRCVHFGCRLPSSFCFNLLTLSKNPYPSPSSVTQQLVCTFFKQEKGGNDQFTTHFCQLKPAQLFPAALSPQAHLAWDSGSRQHRKKCGDFQRGLEIWKGWWGQEERGFKLQTVALVLQL